ncbi:MAG: diacylglycerol/polyprenol kinase family protein [Cellulosilyticaceae bacterium]
MLGVLICYGYVGMILVIAYGLKRYGEERSRKFVHMMTANWWLIAMRFFDTVWGPLLISVSFLIVNLLGERYKLFKQIEVKQRNAGYGTVYYSVSMIILTLLSYGTSNLGIGLVGCLILGYGDGLAALIGQRYPVVKYQIRGNHKSLSGSLSMFAVGIIVVRLVGGLAHHSISVSGTLVIAVTATGLEAIARGGRDNLWVPVVSGVLYAIL